jgi:hypothetical protein
MLTLITLCMRAFPSSYSVLRRFPSNKKILITRVAVAAVLLSMFCILRTVYNLTARTILVSDGQLVAGYLVVTCLELNDSSILSNTVFTPQMPVMLQA